MKYFIMLLLVISITACENEERRAYYEAQSKVVNYKASCVDSEGRTYYEKGVNDFYRDGGNITLYRIDGKRDVITGNCKVEEL